MRNLDLDHRAESYRAENHPTGNEIAEEHEALHRRLVQFRELLARRRTDPGMLLVRVEMLVHDVDAHFRHEEEDGYFDRILEEAPHLQGKIDALKMEHAAFRDALQELFALADTLFGSGEAWETMEQHFQNFLQHFFAHEQAENALLQELYERDFGDSD